ncbi:MAG: hypothetical protein ACJ8AW_37145 [Rhodopila sp.]
MLPFRSLGAEFGDVDMLADGIVEDLIAALSHLRWFNVIARNSSFTYKHRLVPAPQVGKELGVQYVVEGAVRRAADQVRIMVQLVATETGSPVWADRFDGSIADVFSLQDQVVGRVVTAVEPNLRRAEIARLQRQPPTEVPQAYEIYLRALGSMHPMNSANCRAAITLLDQALQKDPTFGLALAASAWCRTWQVALNYASALDAKEETRILAHADAALAAAPDDPTVLAQVSFVFAYLAYRMHVAATLADRAVALHPNSALARAAAGWVSLYNRQPEAAIEHFDCAIKVDPLDPASGEPLVGITLAMMLAGQVEAAVDWGQRCAASNPNSVAAQRALVAALGNAGRQAPAEVARLVELAPGYNTTDYRRLRGRMADHPMTIVMQEGLRRAGLPDAPAAGQSPVSGRSGTV